MILKKKFKASVMAAMMGVFVGVCPVVTYAATTGVADVENRFVNSAIAENSLMDSYIMQQEYVEEGSMVASRMNLQTFVISPRGANSVDFTMSATAEAHLSPLTLKKGESVRIYVFSDGADDKFRAGIIDRSNGRRRYVPSEDGMVGHLFEITKDGEYIVYFTAENGATGNDIRISGQVYVDYLN